MYEGAYTSVKCMREETGDLRVRVGMDQGSAFNPYLFNVICYFADDIVLVGGNREEG